MSGMGARPPSPRRAPSSHRRPTRPGVATAAAVVVSCALLVQGSISTDAAWNDSEWAHGTASTLDCTDAEGAFATRGEGRVLSGGLLGIDLDTIAEASGVEVTNDGSRSLEHGDTATSLGDDAYADPLNVVLLSTVDVNLGQGVLHLPLDNSTGVLGQYGQARSTGHSRGAAGFITESGGIALQPGSGYPELATLRLSQLLGSVNPPVADALSSLTDISLTIGAVTGRAEIDGCAAAWASEATASLVREYLASSIDLDITSDTVGALVTGISETVTMLQATVDGLAGNDGLATSIGTGVAGLLNTILSGPSGSSILRLGTVTVQVAGATIDLSAVQSLLSSPFGDDDGILTVDPSTGTISVSTAALLGSAYPGSYGSGLNGLPPNTNLLADPAIATELNSALGSALADWIADIDSALSTAIDAVTLDVSVVINLQVEATLVVLPVWVDIGHIAASVSGPLSNLTASASVVLLPGLGTIVSGLINGVLSPVLDLLLTTLISDLPSIVAGAIEGALSGLRALPSSVTALTDPILAAVSLVYSSLFLDGVVAVTVNAQNDPASGSPEPADWTALEPGRFDVAALRIGVLGALAQNSVHLYLGRGSVGRMCTMPAMASGGCASY